MKRTSGGPLLARLMIFLMLFTSLFFKSFIYTMELAEGLGEAVTETATETGASATLSTTIANASDDAISESTSGLSKEEVQALSESESVISAKESAVEGIESATTTSEVINKAEEGVTNILNTAKSELAAKGDSAGAAAIDLEKAGSEFNTLKQEVSAEVEAVDKANAGGKGDLVAEPKTPEGEGTPGTEATAPETPGNKFEQQQLAEQEKLSSIKGKGTREIKPASPDEGLPKDTERGTGEGEGEGTGSKEGVMPGQADHSVFSIQGMATTLFSAILFGLPQWAISALQSKLTAKAQLQTIQAPQYFGGLWLQLPSELVNQDNPQNSIFLYSQVTNPDPKKFYGNVGGTGGVVTGNIDRNNFFVPSGSGYGDCGKSGGWAQAGIPTPSFAGQMIHLNSGLEFMGNSDPVSDIYPFRALTGETDFANNNCTSTMTKYLESLAATVQSGQAFQLSYNDVFGGAGMLTASGSYTGGTQKNTQQLQTLAKLLYTSDTDNLLTKSFANENETTKMTSLARLNQPFVIGSPVKRDPTTQDKISGGYQLQALQPTSADQELLFGSVIDNPSADAADSGSSVVASGLFVYQTADTPLAIGARQALRAQGGKSAQQADKAYDYVVTLGESFDYIPAFIPVVNQPAGGANSTKPGSVTWAPNPEVKYIFSLLDNSLFDTNGVPPSSMSGSNMSSMLSQNKIYAGAINGISPTLPTLFSSMAKLLTGSAQTGPFKYGGYVLSVPTELQANQLYTTVPVYTITASANNNKTTLESGDTDYVVALDTNFKPVVLPSGQHKYFASLVTSTLYDNQLVPVASPTQFSILLYTNPSSKSQTAYVATQDTVSGFLQQGAEYACAKCQNLTSPLATLYQEYDINPYNKILSVLSDLTQAITTALQNSDDPEYSGIKQAGVMPRLSNFIATNVVGSLQAAGLTPTLLQDLNAQLPKDTSARNQALQTIGTAVANAVTAALKGGITSGVVSGSLTSVATESSPADLLKLLNAATNKSIATAFAGLGSDKLKDVLPDAVQVVFDSLSRYLGIDAGQSYQVTLAQSGLIPVGAFYIYDSWNLAPGSSSGDDQSNAGGSSAQPLATYFAGNSALATLDQGIKTSHTHWKTWKLTNGQAGALAFEAMGPFGFTTKLLPNIVITATSLDDIKAGDFVYQSSAYPGDYFIVATALGSDNAVEGSENQYTQPFDPANPQPLLISLVSGTVYQRDPSTDQVTILTNAQGLPQQITNLSAVLSSLQSQSLRDQLNVATQAQQNTWPRYSYASFLLTIDPQDVQNNTYIYQDVTGVTKLPPALSDVDAFFVGARKLDDGSMTIGIPLENNPDYIINIATGAFYGPAGLDASTTLPEGTQPGSLLLGQLKGTVRPELRQAIDALAQQAAAAAQTPEETARAAGVPQQLSSALVTKLLSADVPYVGGGYPQLKPYNGKYYGVIGAANDTSGATVGVITDYSAQISTGVGNKATNAVVVYDANGTPTSVLEGLLMDIARKQVGVIVNSDGTQLLGVPNQHPALDLTNGKLAPFTQATTAKLDSGTYDLQQYTNTQLPGLQVIAKYTSAGSAASVTDAAYINIFSGDQFDSTGSPIIANYPVNVNAADNSVIALFNADPANLSAFGIGPDNYYHNYGFYRSFTSSDGTTQYTALQDVPGNTEYLAITPAQLSSANTWTVRMGQQGNSPLFAPTSYTFAPQTGADAMFARAYTYVGSGDTSLIGAQGPVFQANKVSANPNYASNGTLVAIGQLANGVFAPSQLFVAPVEAATSDQSGIDFTALPADGYIALTSTAMATVKPGSDKSSAASVQAASSGQPLTFNAPATNDGTVINYPVKFYGGLVDANTGAQYIAIQDQNGVHFYTPHYQTTDAQTLQKIQQQLQLYISLAMTGDIGLFKPLPPAVNLTQIQTMIGVPTDQEDAIKAFLAANTFWYDQTSQRYLYQFSQDDANELYYQPNAMYVDLRMGVLYDQNGIPTGSSLTYPQLQLLFNDKRFGLPAVGETYDPSTYQAPQGTAVVAVQGTPGQATPSFLHYAP